MSRAKFPKVTEMSCQAVDVKPVDFDPSVGFGDTWDYVEAVCCEKCGLAVVGSGGGSHADCDDDADCDGYVPTSEGPIMNYWYPVEINDTEEAARLLVGLPLCVVTVSDATGLALTGGGMDLSWEICEAFMRLGMLPPAHFANLPGMAGRGTSAKDRWIASGCIRSCNVAAGWMQSRAARVRETLRQAKARADEDKATSRVDA